MFCFSYFMIFACFDFPSGPKPQYSRYSFLVGQKLFKWVSKKCHVSNIKAFPVRMKLFLAALDAPIITW